MSDLVAKYVFPDVAKAFELMDEEELQMSRPIKFRAWDIDHYIEDCIVVDEKTIMVFDEGNGFYEMVSVGCVEQYTGLKDKNGKEIYEGDIVRRVEEGGFNIIGIVEWSEKAARFWVKRYYYPNGNKWEVIGNIHENKDLSGGEE